MVSARVHSGVDGKRGSRECAGYGKSTARAEGGRKSGGTASIEWVQHSTNAATELILRHFRFSNIFRNAFAGNH